MSLDQNLAELDWFSAELRRREGRVMVRHGANGGEWIIKLDPIEVYGRGEHNGRFAARLRETRVWSFPGGVCAIAQSVALARALIREHRGESNNRANKQGR